MLAATTTSLESMPCFAAQKTDDHVPGAKDDAPMEPALRLRQLLSVSALLLAACADIPDSNKIASLRDQAVAEIQRKTGAPVSLEVSETGGTRVLAMSPKFPAPGHATDPVIEAQTFLTAHHDIFQLDTTEATQFVVIRVDNEPTTGLHHVTLNRTYNDIPVFQGGISVHMDSGNNVYRVFCDESYNISAPTNRIILSPSDAVAAAGHALGVKLSPVVVESDGQHTMFSSAGALDPIHVAQKIFHVAPGSDRFAYQATVSWLDEHQQQQYQLALVDAQDGSLLANHSLVNTFTGKVFTASPGAHPTNDTRQSVSFDGDPAASPIGWVGAPALPSATTRSRAPT